MKFWLSCFFLLFVGAELFDWIAQLGSMQMHGSWLVLGGIGLAVASNAAHLPKLSSTTGAESSEAVKQVAEDTAVAKPDAATEQRSFMAEKAGEDSISFKVRSPWR